MAPAKPPATATTRARADAGTARADGLGEVVGEPGQRDGQGVARTGGALAEDTAVRRGGEDGPGAGTAGVEADHEAGPAAGPAGSDPPDPGSNHCSLPTMVVDTFAADKPRPTDRSRLRGPAPTRGGSHPSTPLRRQLHAPPRLVPLLARLRPAPRPRGPGPDSRPRPRPRPGLPPLAAAPAQPHADPHRGRRPAGAAGRPGGRGGPRRPGGRRAGPPVQLRLLSGVDPQLAPPQRLHRPGGGRRRRRSCCARSAAPSPAAPTSSACSWATNSTTWSSTTR